MTTWFSLLLSSMLTLASSLADTELYQAKIEATHQDGQLVIRAHCLNKGNEPVQLRYELEAERIGSGGSSRNVQSGRCQLGPKQDVVVSELALSAGQTDTYSISLRLLDSQGQLLAIDSLKNLKR